MSTTQLTEPSNVVSTVSKPPAQEEPTEPSGSGVSPWVARGIITGVAALMAWYTWGHWGSFEVDNGRELYVPAEILKGKLLYRDLWYMYGPVAPYLKAGLFWLFGVHLTVLYLFGLALAIGTALLTFEVSRRFQLGTVVSMVPALFFLSESFDPSIRNFVFPYSYAASLGAFLGMACLLFVLMYSADKRKLHLGLAALLASLVLLTKQEIGYACLILLGFTLAGEFRRQRSFPELLRNLALCCAGLVPTVAVYGWFVWKLSARVLFFENWISTPGTYFMRTYSKLTLADQGFRFVPSEMLKAAAFTALALVLWGFFASVAVSLIKELKLKSWFSIAAGCLASLIPLGMAGVAFVSLYPIGYVVFNGWATDYLLVPVVQAVFPKGIFFLVVLFTLHALWRLWRVPEDVAALLEAALGIYASFVALRQMMELRPTIFTAPPYFNGPAFVVFIIVVYRIIRKLCQPLDARSADLAVSSLLAGEVAMLFLLFGPNPRILPERFTSGYGSFYTQPDVATIFPQIISFMKTHTKNEKDILVLPEPPSLYVFAGMDAPSRWYSLVPGYVAPEQEQQYIDDLKANQVRYVLIANRILVEYGVMGFLQGGFNKGIHRWIMDNYVKVGQFGPVPTASLPYNVWIFERKDLVSDEQPKRSEAHE